MIKIDMEMPRFCYECPFCLVISDYCSYCMATKSQLKISELDLRDKDRKWWKRIIQLLPQSYIQRSTVMMNYQVLRNIYLQRKGHRLSEWHEFREWAKTLPYAGELICI